MDRDLDTYVDEQTRRAEQIVQSLKAHLKRIRRPGDAPAIAKALTVLAVNEHIQIYGYDQAMAHMRAMFPDDQAQAPYTAERP
jgi:hypothetical protein